MIQLMSSTHFFPEPLQMKKAILTKHPRVTGQIMENRYRTSDLPVIMQTLPQGWIPEVTIIDCMFLVNSKPLRRTKTITEYAHQIYNRFALEQFCQGVNEVHIVFDKPGRQPFNPKQFEHVKRDKKNRCTNTQHEHIEFTPHTPIPQAWRDYINCRQCKRSIIEAIGLAFCNEEVRWFSIAKSWL